MAFTYCKPRDPQFHSWSHREGALKVEGAQCSPLKPLEIENKINDAVFPSLPPKTPCAAFPKPPEDTRLTVRWLSNVSPASCSRAQVRDAGEKPNLAAHPNPGNAGRGRGSSPAPCLGHGTDRARGGRAAWPRGTIRSQKQIKGTALAACPWKVPARSSSPPNLLTSSCLQSSSLRLA